MTTRYVYVSNGQDATIGCYRLDPGGALAPAGSTSTAAVPGPLAVSPDRRFLFLASRGAPFGLHSYSIDAATGALTHIASGPAVASFPFIVLDRTGRFLLAASYASHLACVYAVGADGRIAADPVQVVPVGRNAHSIRVDGTNCYAYVPTLGTDQVFEFTFDAESGRLASNTPAIAATAQGAGPRHCVTTPDNRFLYVVNEMMATVTTFAIDAATGLLAERGSVSGLPPDTILVPGAPRGGPVPRDTTRDIWAADIHLTPDARFLYISERTGSTIGAFRVDGASGALTYLSSTPTESRPRGFAIDPAGQFMVVSGEGSDTVSVYAIDAADGALRFLARYPSGKGATWVEIVSFT